MGEPERVGFQVNGTTCTLAYHDAGFEIEPPATHAAALEIEVDLPFEPS